VIDAARIISQVLDHPCAERLQPSLVFMAKHLRNHRQLFLDEKTISGLESISISTLKRTLANINKSADKIGRKRFPKRKRNTLAIQNIFSGWVLMACILIFMRWQERQPILLISRQLNPLLFAIIGILTGVITMIWQVKR
jgi:hypothetical protein